MTEAEHNPSRAAVHKNKAMSQVSGPSLAGIAVPNNDSNTLCGNTNFPPNIKPTDPWVCHEQAHVTCQPFTCPCQGWLCRKLARCSGSHGRTVPTCEAGRPPQPRVHLPSSSVCTVCVEGSAPGYDAGDVWQKVAWSPAI